MSTSWPYAAGLASHPPCTLARVEFTGSRFAGIESALDPVLGSAVARAGRMVGAPHVVGRAARRRGSCCSQRDTGPACCRRPGRGARPAIRLGTRRPMIARRSAPSPISGWTAGPRRRGRHVGVVRDVDRWIRLHANYPTMRPPCRARSACTTGTGSSARSAMRARSRRRTESVLVVGSPGRCGRWRSGARLPWPRRSRSALDRCPLGRGAAAPRTDD